MTEGPGQGMSGPLRPLVFGYGVVSYLILPE